MLGDGRGKRLDLVRMQRGEIPQECTTEGASAHFAETDAHTTGGLQWLFLPHFADEEANAHVAADGLS